MRDFVQPTWNDAGIDRFIVRNEIFKVIKESCSTFKGRLLDVGCGKMPYRAFILDNSSVQDYVGLDIDSAISYDENIGPDVTWDGVSMPFESNTFDCALATEVLEHCPNPEIILGEVYRVLKPGGRLVFTVPFLWNLHEVPNDEYRYTPFSLERHLRNVGFERITISPTGGWHTSMAQMLGLWVERSPMTRRKRNVLLPLIRPLIKKLYGLGQKERVTFREGQMISGLSGIVIK